MRGSPPLTGVLETGLEPVMRGSPFLTGVLETGLEPVMRGSPPLTGVLTYEGKGTVPRLGFIALASSHVCCPTFPL